MHTFTKWVSTCTQEAFGTHAHTHRKSVSRPVKHIESQKKSRKEKSVCALKQREINKNFTYMKENMKVSRENIYWRMNVIWEKININRYFYCKIFKLFSGFSNSVYTFLWCFSNVILTHTTQPLAQYFLAKCKWAIYEIKFMRPFVFIFNFITESIKWNAHWQMATSSAAATVASSRLNKHYYIAVLMRLRASGKLA